VQPSRLARSVEKIHDLLHQRGSAKTCLIAYSGTAHLVMPATTDGNIINTFAQSLDPEIMPVEGDAAAEALQLADQALSDCGGGSVWWITDDIPQDQVSKLQKWFGESKSRVNVLPAIAPGREADLLAQSGRDLGADVVALSADDSDIGELAKLSNFKPTLGDDEQGRWADSGYWLTPLLVILLLPLFRRGTSALGH
jgi:Ca-activated chloride channel family protein